MKTIQENLNLLMSYYIQIIILSTDMYLLVDLKMFWIF